MRSRAEYKLMIAPAMTPEPLLQKFGHCKDKLNANDETRLMPIRSQVSITK